jgi:hypothetical protein
MKAMVKTSRSLTELQFEPIGVVAEIDIMVHNVR